MNEKEMTFEMTDETVEEMTNNLGEDEEDEQQ